MYPYRYTEEGMTQLKLKVMNNKNEAHVNLVIFSSNGLLGVSQDLQVFFHLLTVATVFDHQNLGSIAEEALLFPQRSVLLL